MEIVKNKDTIRRIGLTDVIDYVEEMYHDDYDIYNLFVLRNINDIFYFEMYHYEDWFNNQNIYKLISSILFKDVLDNHKTTFVPYLKVIQRFFNIYQKYINKVMFDYMYNGQCIIHMINQNDIWYGVYCANKDCIVSENIPNMFKNPTDFAKTHHLHEYGYDWGWKGNGWNECMCFIDGEWKILNKIKKKNDRK